MNMEILHWVLTLALGASNFLLWVHLLAMKNSTHQISYVNPFRGGKLQAVTDDEREALTKEYFDNLA